MDFPAFRIDQPLCASRTRRDWRRHFGQRGLRHRSVIKAWPTTQKATKVTLSFIPCSKPYAHTAHRTLIHDQRTRSKRAWTWHPLTGAKTGFNLPGQSGMGAKGRSTTSTVVSQGWEIAAGVVS